MCTYNLLAACVLVSVCTYKLFPAACFLLLQLLQCVLPALDGLLAFAEEVHQLCKPLRKGRNSASGDESAVAVLKMAVYWRKVYIEDSVYFQPMYPQLPAYRCHPMFRNTRLRQLWQKYAEEERCGVRLREISFKQTATLPESLLMQVNELKVAANNASMAAMAAASAAAAAAADAAAARASPPPAADKAAADAAAAAADAAEEHPLPALDKTITNMVVYYRAWRNGGIKAKYEANMASNKGKPSWKVHYGGEADKMSKRYTQSAAFFSFLDSLPVEGAMGTEVAMGLMVQFAELHGIKHTNMVRVVFHHMVRGLTSCSPDVKALCSQLREMLTDAGFVVPVIETLQDQSKRLNNKRQKVQG